MMFFRTLATLLLWAAPVFAMLFASKQLMQFVQLSSYQATDFVRALQRLPHKSIWPGIMLTVAGIFLLLGFFALKAAPVLAFILSAILVVLLLVAGYAIGLMAYQKKKVKVPLVVTARVKRLYVFFALVGLLLCWLLWHLGAPFGVSALIPLLAPLWLLLAMYVSFPVEKVIQLVYRRDASNILNQYRASGLTVIGITGSYGKTTVKNILGAMLSQQFPTLSSPASFNTPLGLARVIREELGQQHRYFIAEMGARHPQDIRVLSRMIKPQMGLLVSIGPQHLQTLGNIDRVRDTKYELIKGLPADGFAVFNDDGKHVSECYQKTTLDKMLVGDPDSDLWAEEVRLSTDGSAFTLCLKDGTRQELSTRLSGEHNVRNILLAAAMALRCGVSLQQIARAMEEIQPVASRLQVSTHHKGYRVINNGFNSNPDSSRKALEVLSGFPGRLIVVTPGFIELGRQEARSNRRLGNDIAAVASIAILVGEKHTRPIKEGLLESGMPLENIHVFPSLQDANEFIIETFGEGDVLLYENDLPDHYA